MIERNSLSAELSTLNTWATPVCNYRSNMSKHVQIDIRIASEFGLMGFA